MNLDYVPLLAVQRDLYRLPRGMDRFRQYLRTILSAEHDDVDFPPLVAVNPMAKEPVAALLDELLALDADGVAARAAIAAAAELGAVGGDFKAALVVVDDAGGGWTNRYACEYTLRLVCHPPGKRFWVTGVLWSSEPASGRGVRETMRAAVYRTAHALRHGTARTLRQMLAQEGYALAHAGCTAPALDADDLAYTREVLTPLLDAEADLPTAVACLFGDAAARTLGFPPQGLSPWAGIALALHDARAAVRPARIH
jgi:hypothetical protein